MKLYPLLSHNIEIVKFLGPITTNPMKQNEQEKSLNTNQRHSAVQCNAYAMIQSTVTLHTGSSKKVHYEMNEMKKC